MKFIKGQIPWNKGKNHTKESIEKMRLIKFGKKRKGNPKNWKHNEETKKKMSLAKKGKPGNNSKGGICKDKNYVSWIKNKRNRTLKRTKELFGSHTYGDWELLKKQYNYTCPCCHKSEPEIKLTEDHIIPLSRGGSDLIENIQPLCQKCNMKKFTKITKFICD